MADKQLEKMRINLTVNNVRFSLLANKTQLLINLPVQTILTKRPIMVQEDNLHGKPARSVRSLLFRPYSKTRLTTNGHKINKPIYITSFQDGG